MVTYFLDTSALFKRYISEEGSDAIANLFDSEGLLLISAVTLCETVSNLRRLSDIDKVIDEKEFEALRATFLGDVADGRLEVMELTTPIVLASLDIISSRFLTPIDALQIATALSLPEKPVFVCADQKLNQVAMEYGLPALDPLHPEDSSISKT